ncbi:hypothetical protein PHMEG_0008541 [Phytophthora megakarya]|uniref:Uncharacterized protein n=1 Tax=Phytophthora megakarya TaxID=4795 RepID=A0A225WIG2_9STRA|nr:hypothetical protein PHMEG_0008541 [Phytophthora megakarya]
MMANNSPGFATPLASCKMTFSVAPGSLATDTRNAKFCHSKVTRFRNTIGIMQNDFFGYARLISNRHSQRQVLPF